MKVLARVVSLAQGEGLPTEFRLFGAGKNATTKGEFLFDDAAAAAVMSAFKAQGVQHMIDLEHESLDAPTRADSRDARGWYDLEVRPGPELWAVNVRWTPDGARRLGEKTQRYISPAFCMDDENRVIEVVNCALVAMPATHATQALVAAARDLHAPAARVTAKNVSAQVRANAYLLAEKIKQWDLTKSKPRSKR